MSCKAKQKGTAFENRTLRRLNKLGAYNAERVPLSGNSIYSKWQGDLTWSFIINEENILRFRSECKKRNSENSLVFETDWLIDIDDKAQKTNCVGCVFFSGKYKPIFVMLGEKTFFSLFGNFNAIKMVDYPSRGKTHVTINWNKMWRILGDGRSLTTSGQWKTGKGFTTKFLHIVKFETEITMYCMVMDDFILSLKDSLNFAQSKWF